MSPYWGNGFFAFFATFFERFILFSSGKLKLIDLAPDEIQILVLLFISLSSALVGTFFVLRRMTMLANSLSHTILLGIVATLIIMRRGGGMLMHLDFKALIIASLITGFLTTWVTEWFHKELKLQEDASIGLVFTTFFSLGIIGVTLFSRSAHLGVEAIMGNVDALHIYDLKLSFSLFLLNGLLVFLLYGRYALLTFDPILAKNFGLPIFFLNHLLMTQLSITAIGAFRAVGVFLFLAFLVIPPLTARLVTHRLKPLLFLSCFIGVIASFIGVAVSRHLLSFYQVSLSTAGLTTIVLGGLFFIGILYRSVLRSIKKLTLIQNCAKATTDSMNLLNVN